MIPPPWMIHEIEKEKEESLVEHLYLELPVADYEYTDENKELPSVITINLV